MVRRGKARNNSLTQSSLRENKKVADNRAETSDTKNLREDRVRELSDALDERSRELQLALECQTATNKVLDVISRSTDDVQLVFDTIAKSSARLCAAEVSTVCRFDGKMVRLEAIYGSNTKSIAAIRRAFPMPPSGESAAARTIQKLAVVHIPDVQLDEEYGIQDTAMAAGFRAIVAVPMLHQGRPIGAIAVGRSEPGVFQDTQVQLLQTFADQAVIAIENVRQFEEIREKSRLVETQAAELAELNQTLESRVEEQVEEIGRMSKLTRFLSPKISNLIMSGEVDDPLKTRRAEITAVYVDLRGFTSFTETADPEEVMTVLREYHSELGRAITEHDATIEHYAGDGAMILLNAPLPTEDHTLRAIEMCLQIRKSIGALTDAWRKRGFALGCGAGIAGGYATLGMIGFEGRMDYSAVGTVCNLAARLSDESEHGQILIPSRILLQVEDLVEVEPLGERAFKGIQRSIEVYNVLGLRSPNGT